jgi:DNA recombination protein RmuC
MYLSFLLLVLLGWLAVGLGVLVGWLWASGRARAEAAGRQAAEGALARAQAEYDRLRTAFDGAIREVATLEAQDKAAAGQISQLQQLREETEQKFGTLAATALRSSEQAFLRLANETFEKHREGNKAELETKRQELDALVAPLRETLVRYEEKLGAVEKERADAYGGLREMVEQMRIGQDKVQSETARLANALKGSAKMRGNWGELQLRNVLEKAGLSQHVDFRTEVSVETDDGRRRPDAIVRMPGGRNLIIDAKASLSAYQAATDTDDDVLKRGHLLEHARAMKLRAVELGDKKYQREFSDTADFVIMFVPGDHFVHAAMEQDPDLWEDAFARGVIIASPIHLIALARTVAQAWRQEKMAEDAVRVANLARELYKRMTTLGGKIQDVGKRLGSAVEAYNGMVGSLESSVLPHARKFTELNVEGAEKPLLELQPIETLVRTPGGRDLQLAAQPDETPKH